MQRFSEFIIKWRLILIPLVIVLTFVFAYQLRNLKINSDILSYLPQDDPAVKLFNKVGEQFGGSSLAMVALETDDVFNAATLQRIRKLTEAYEGLEGVRDVVSLTNILDIKKIEGGLEVGKLVDVHQMPEPQAVTPAQAAELKALKDYHEALLDEIASVAGISKATIYLYFDNKIDLFISVAERKLKEMTSALRKLLLCLLR